MSGYASDQMRRNYMVGINTFGLARKIQEDQSRTLQRLARIGFDLVEPLLAPIKEQGEYPKVVLSRETLPQFIQECGDLGLAIQTAHVFADPTLPVQRVIDHLVWTQQQTGISNFVFSGQMETFAQAEEQAAFMSSLSEALKKDGCQILYHNHARELRPIIEDDGKTAMDHFFKTCDSSILLQLDAGWAGVAGNEAEIAARFASRIFSLHFKDFSAGIRGVYTEQTMPQEKFVAVGSGDIHSAQIIAMCKDFPQFGGSLIIDQDHSTRDIFEDIELGYRWLRGISEA